MNTEKVVSIIGNNEGSDWNSLGKDESLKMNHLPTCGRLLMKRFNRTLSLILLLKAKKKTRTSKITNKNF